MIVIIILFFLGLCFGSFINALVWRLHQQSQKPKAKKFSNYKLQTTNYSILSGRSMCPNCGHELVARDLVPIFSWLALRGHCRYCGQAISWQYPLVELASGLIFVASYHFWPGGVSGLGETILFVSWLATSVGLLALLVYDFRWMLLPNRIIYPTLAVAVIGQLVYLIDFEPHKLHRLLMWLLSTVIASGLFWLIFMYSKGRWIGYGDVRLGLITGTVLAQPFKSLLMIFIASLVGTLFVLPSLLSRHRQLTAKIPFGPFLIAATGITILFGQHLIDWYKRLLING